MTKFLKKSLKNLNSYKPGRQNFIFQGKFDLKNVIKLSSNESILGPSPMILEGLKKSLTQINYYPDSQNKSLRNLIAELNEISPDNILLTNGAAEAIDLIAFTFIDQKTEVILNYPTFPKYQIASEKMGAKIINVKMVNYNPNIEMILQNISKKTKVIFIDSPNNPIGTSLSQKDFNLLISNLPNNIILIIDEAYKEFIQSENFIDYKILINKKNILFIRSFSKAFGLAGLRLGYIIGSQDLLSDVNKVREVFNVNSLAINAGYLALVDKAHFYQNLNLTNNNKNYIYLELNKLGFEYVKSDTNFILINTKRNLDEVDNFLMEHKIIVRPIPIRNQRNGYIRVTIGNEYQINIFLAVMKKLKENVNEL